MSERLDRRDDDRPPRPERADRTERAAAMLRERLARSGSEPREREPEAPGPGRGLEPSEQFRRDVLEPLLNRRTAPPPELGPPFYREVRLNSSELARIGADVDARISRGEAASDQRERLLQTGVDAAFDAKARLGEFFSYDKKGVLAAELDNATPSEWASELRDQPGVYEQSAFVLTRAYEVRVPVGTEFYESTAAAQHGRAPETAGERGYPEHTHADLVGGGEQVWIPRTDDRGEWRVVRVSRSHEEDADLVYQARVTGREIGAEQLFHDAAGTAAERHAGDRLLGVYAPVEDPGSIEVEQAPDVDPPAPETLARLPWRTAAGSFRRKRLGPEPR